MSAVDEKRGLALPAQHDVEPILRTSALEPSARAISEARASRSSIPFRIGSISLSDSPGK
jgi:hypothetical protein